MSNDIHPSPQGNGNTEVLSITIEIDGTSRVLPPINIISADTKQILMQQIREARSVIFRHWEHATTLPKEVINELIKLTQLSGPTIQITSNGRDWPDPFQATTAIRLDSGNLEQVSRLLALAVTAAAICQPNAVAASAASIRAWCTHCGVASDSTASIAKQIREVLGVTQTPGLHTPQNLANTVLAHLQMQRERRGEDPGLTPPLRYWNGQYFQWNGSCWLCVEDLEPKVVRILQQVAENVPLKTNTVSSTLMNIKALTLFSCDKAPVYVDSEDPLHATEQQVLVCKNAVLDFRDFSTRSPDPRLFATMQIPHDFDPQARCPLWEQTLSEILPRVSDDDHRIEVLQEYAGYSLMTWNFGFQKFLMAVGRGGNGKSTVLRTIRHLYGAKNVSEIPLSAFAGEFRLGKMTGKFVNIADDMPRMEKVDEGLLKQLVTGEPTDINRKHREPVTMYPTAKLWFAFNTPPPISDTSDGMWRRFLLLPFRERFDLTDHRDLNRAGLLEAEVCGILNWALAGARRLLEQGHFTPCEVCEQELANYRGASSSVNLFIDDCCVLGDEYSIATEELYRTYANYCCEHGYKPKCHANFGKDLHGGAGIEKSRPGGSGRRPSVYRGIGLAEGVDGSNLTRRTPTSPRPRR
ncbi:phage/plasmid primase, P4 family [Bremerella sp. JC770]|uniref:DNA primase family protein n=1 Tax=Bremerella sp. JC770 TaxID=3232137 RepID=UPI00345ABCF1